MKKTFSKRSWTASPSAAPPSARPLLRSQSYSISSSLLISKTPNRSSLCSAPAKHLQNPNTTRRTTRKPKTTTRKTKSTRKPKTTTRKPKTTKKPRTTKSTRRSTSSSTSSFTTLYHYRRRRHGNNISAGIERLKNMYKGNSTAKPEDLVDRLRPEGTEQPPLKPQPVCGF